MRNLKKGSMVRYTGKTTGFFTYNKIYKVVEEAYEQYFSKTYAVKIKDDISQPHIITEDYFDSYFTTEKRTLVVNLFGGAGVGKSTLMAQIFAELKIKGYDCEMVTEFAKDLIWEKRDETFKDELYIFAKQNHRMFRVNGKVDIIVTDRPLLLTNAYNQHDKELCDLCLKTFNEYNNLNILLKREVTYQPNGRNQTEEEAIEIDNITRHVLESNGIDYYVFTNNDIKDIMNTIEGKIRL